MNESLRQFQLDIKALIKDQNFSQIIALPKASQKTKYELRQIDFCWYKS